MRISVMPDDPGFRPDAPLYDVLLDGDSIRNCFTADDELGEVHVYRTDENGDVVLDQQGRFIGEVRTGKVRLLWRPNAK